MPKDYLADYVSWHIMLTISIGVPALEAYVAACLLRSWDLSLMFTKLPASITISRALE